MADNFVSKEDLQHNMQMLSDIIKEHTLADQKIAEKVADISLILDRVTQRQSQYAVMHDTHTREVGKLVEFLTGGDQSKPSIAIRLDRIEQRTLVGEEQAKKNSQWIRWLFGSGIVAAVTVGGIILRFIALFNEHAAK